MVLKACSVIAISFCLRKEGSIGSDFSTAGFFHPVYVFQICYSDADAESVCPYYSLKGNLLCDVIDFHHFVSAINTPLRFAVE